MNPWALWLDALRSLLEVLSFQGGFGLGLAIIASTVVLRAALLPISWPVAYRSCIRQKKMMRLQPQLQSLKERYGHRPEIYVQRLMALYEKHDLTLFDGRALVGALVQMPLFIGMFHVLRATGDGVRFLWVQSLLRPDAWLAVIAGITTALMIAVNPDVPEQMRAILIIVPAVIAVVAALKFSSALAVYWATSNCFSALQTVVLHLVVGRRLRAGTLKI